MINRAIIEPTRDRHSSENISNVDITASKKPEDMELPFKKTKKQPQLQPEHNRFL